MARKRSKQGPPRASSSSESATSKRQKADATRVVSDSDSDSGKSLSSPNDSAFTVDLIVPNSNKSAPSEDEVEISEEDSEYFCDEYPFMKKWFDKFGRFVDVASFGREKLKKLESQQKQMRIMELELCVEKCKIYQALAEEEMEFLKGNRI